MPEGASYSSLGVGNGFDAASLLTPARDSPVDVPPWDRTPDVAGTVAAIRSAGDLFAGSGLLNQRHTPFVSHCTWELVEAYLMQFVLSRFTGARLAKGVAV